MKNILIFTASMGGGHNEAAFNLRDHYVKNGYNVKVLDILELLSKILNTSIKKTFNFITDRYANLYAKLYTFVESENTNELIFDSMNIIFKEKFYDIILEENPTLIISTHGFPVNIIGHLKENNRIHIPYIAVITDFDTHRAYINQNVDAYIVANEYTSRRLANNGISKDKIFSYGIPIKKDFLKINKESVGKEKTFNILIMAGSLGLKSMDIVLENLVKLDGDYKITAVCGHNEKLKESLEEKFEAYISSRKVNFYGFTDDIPTLMAKSDLLITKPGGLTISEAMAEGLPMIIPYYIPVQEKKNLDFLLNENIAIYTPDMDNMLDTIKKIMDNPSSLDTMRNKMVKMYNSYCLENILSLGEKLVDEYKS